jgi:nucleotide-binding universal stress UspA family protein
MEHLVVGVDGSTGADRALAWAIREARSWDARLTIVHCYPTLPTGH